MIHYVLSALLTILGTQAGVTPRSPLASSVEGAVVASATQQGIPGVTVTLFQGTPSVTRPSVLPPDVQFRGAAGTSNGLPQPSRAQTSVVTDQQGRFSFRDVAPGGYRLVVVAAGYDTGEGTPLTVTAGIPVRNIRFSFRQLSSITGRILKERAAFTGATVVLLRSHFSPEGERRLEQVAQTTVDKNGEYLFSGIAPQSYYVATYLVGPRSTTGQPSLAVPLTYYPGHLESRDAVAIRVNAAPIVLGDIHISDSPLRRISGRLTDSRGQPPDDATFQLTCWLATSGRLTVSADQKYSPETGVFELSGLPPCSYQIVATAPLKVSAPGKDTFRATAMVEVFRGDVGNLRLIEPVERSITGRLRFIGPSSAADSANLASVRVEFETNLRHGVIQPIQPMHSNVVGPDLAVNFAPTNQLEVGDYRLILRYLPADYYVKRLLINGADASTQKVQFSPFVANTVEVFLSTTGGRITGTVLQSQLVASNVRVNLVPRPPLDSDRYKTVRTDANGQFAIRGVTPGQYLLFASNTFDPTSYFDSALKEFLEQNGRVITVSDATSVNVQVNVVPPTDK